MNKKPEIRRVGFEMEIDVAFSDPEKVKAYFIDSDWQNVFWKVSDLQDLAEMLAHHFHMERDYFSSEEGRFCRSPEGFGVYVDQHGGKYALNKAGREAIGSEITLSYRSELEVMGCDLVPAEGAA